jgi:photosystem II stability/assembly factor-like uncharacterized protein
MRRKTSPNRCTATLVLLLATLTTKRINAQFDIEDSNTTASLRGIHNVGGGVAWASGTNGTVLRSEDGGYLWQTCNIPPGAEKLDFRGIQAFDENTAIVMSSGPGDQSRLYKTTDGCQTWKLLFTNPDKEGFWDAIKFPNPKLGFILGDPVTVPIPHASTTTPPFTGFAILATEDAGAHFRHWTFYGNQAAAATHGAFAASNSALFVGWPFVYFGSGGTAGPRVFLNAFQQHISFPDGRIEIESGDWHSNSWSAPLAQGEAAGIFSIVFLKSEKADKEALDTSDLPTLHGVAVGGDYKKADSTDGTAAFTSDGGQHWSGAQTPPHGYRSSVAYDPTQKLWITVGPNGTDISTDDGKSWHPLTPSGYDPPDADKNWNALSLPFVVGPHGRIGKLRTITNPSK